MDKRTRTGIELGADRFLDLGGRSLVMGIVNCTPDSFYPSSRQANVGSAMAAACDMIEEGADLLDFGGESTRPGAAYVDADEQIRRIVPVITDIRKRSHIPISVDTRIASVASAALDAGADIINDVTGLSDDSAMASLAAKRDVPVIIMHMRGTSRTMQKNPHYDDTIAEICDELSIRAESAISAGIDRKKIILDPGIGFGKRVEDNLRIIGRIDLIKALGFPVLLGISRKSFIDRVLDRAVEDRLIGSLAAEAWGVIRGVEIVRVHDVRPTVDLIRMIEAIRGES